MVVGEFGPLGHNLHQGMVVLGALVESPGRRREHRDESQACEAESRRQRPNRRCRAG
jgi:hypothetical protein